MLNNTRLMLLNARSWLQHRVDAMAGNDRGDAYSGTVMLAFGVIIAITVGTILMVTFRDKAEDIDTDVRTEVTWQNSSGG